MAKVDIIIIITYVLKYLSNLLTEIVKYFVSKTTLC